MAGHAKPQTVAGYSEDHTRACEQVLVALLNAFGTLKHTLRLVGGLTPRYLTPESAPTVPPHFGTSDVDVVLNLQVIAEGEGYDSLAHQLETRGFRLYNDPERGIKTWRWEYPLSENTSVLVEFLQGGNGKGGRPVPIDGEAVAALVIPHAEMTHDWYLEKEISAELPGGRGVAVETIRFADVVAFIVLKAIAFDNRGEPKDAADLIHVMQYAGDPEHIARLFVERISGNQYPESVAAGLAALRQKFAEGSGGHEGYKLTGPVNYGLFIHGHGEDNQDARVRAQRFASGLVTEVLELINTALAQTKETVF